MKHHLWMSIPLALSAFAIQASEGLPSGQPSPVGVVDPAGALGGPEDTLQSPRALPTQDAPQSQDALESQGSMETEGSLDAQGALETPDMPRSRGRLESDGTLETQGALEIPDTVETDGTLGAQGTLDSDDRLDTDGTLGTRGRLETDGSLESQGVVESEERVDSEGALESQNAVDQVPANNSGINKRDRDSGSMTADDQSQSQTDVALVAKLRRAVMDQEGLSVDGQNIKIITTENGITLRGPVESMEERTAIEAAVRTAAGTATVDSQLEVR